MIGYGVPGSNGRFIVSLNESGPLNQSRSFHALAGVSEILVATVHRHEALARNGKLGRSERDKQSPSSYGLTYTLPSNIVKNFVFVPVGQPAQNVFAFCFATWCIADRSESIPPLTDGLPVYYESKPTAARAIALPPPVK